MIDLQERKRFRTILHSKTLSFILLLIVLVLLRSNYYIYKTNQIAKMNREESDRRLALLRGQSERLSSALQKLNTDRGIEDEIRNKFQVTKSGEGVLVVVDDVPPQNVKNAVATGEDGGYWNKFMALLGF